MCAKALNKRYYVRVCSRPQYVDNAGRVEIKIESSITVYSAITQLNAKAGYTRYCLVDKH